MKRFSFFIFITLFTTSLFAKTHEGKFEYTAYEAGFTTVIEVKYKIWTLYGEPVINTVARYKIVNGSVSIDGHSYKLSEFPKAVIEKIRLYKLELQVPFETTYSTGNILYIDTDMGAMGKAGEWSFNTAGSPKWDKWIYHANYLSKARAIQAYKGFKKLSFYETGEYTKKIKYDITALKRYISKQKLERENARLKEEYTAETVGLNKEIDKIYKLDQKIVSRLQEKYGDESLYQVMTRLQKGNEKKEELAVFMKALEESEKLTLKQKPFQEKINRFIEKHEEQLKAYEDENTHTLLEIDKELKQINYFIDAKREEVKNRKLPKQPKINKNIWVDKEAGLVWQDDTDAKTIRKYWSDAKYYCQNLTLADYRDWYLPNKSQLLALYKKKSKLKNVIPEPYFSSTSDVIYTRLAYIMDFGNGYDGYNEKAGKWYVRCVRTK